MLQLIREAGGDVIGVDWRIDLAAAWRLLSDGVAVQGNLDPVALFAPWPELQRRAQAVLDQAAGRPGTSSTSATASAPDAGGQRAPAGGLRPRVQPRAELDDVHDVTRRADAGADGGAGARAQDAICRAIENLEGPAGARFLQDEWSRPGGGGGTTRVLQQGAVFEKAGVNVSCVHGLLAPNITAGAAGGGPAPVDPSGAPVPFFAAGLSLVLHPHNPMAPTAHANYRYFELGAGPAPASWWFGGGADLTPAYLFEEDAAHFHRAHKAACDRYDAALYPRLKRACDAYFFLPHRGERRGVGGSSSTASPATTGRGSSLSCGAAPTPSSPPTCPSSRPARTPPSPRPSGAGRSCAGAGTSSSTWSTTGARCSASRPAAGPRAC